MLRANCIICESPISPIQTAQMPQHTVNCPVCGKYVASQEFLEDQLNQTIVPTRNRYLVSAWIKWHPLSGLDAPVLSEEACRLAVENAPQFTPVERMERLLLSLTLRLPRPGPTIRIATGDYPYAWAADEQECSTYVHWLRDAAYIETRGNVITVTQKGWERATELQRDFRHAGRRAFVAMWFDDSFDAVWRDGLLPGIRDSGYEPYRIKEDIHGERIDFRIIAAIRGSRFLVADVSEPRTAVYYEAGFAEGLGKLVIWTCREDRLATLSFDTRQFRHIAWRDPTHLRIELAATIRALLPS